MYCNIGDEASAGIRYSKQQTDFIIKILKITGDAFPTNLLK